MARRRLTLCHVWFKTIRTLQKEPLVTKLTAVDPVFTRWSPEVIKAAIAMRGMTLRGLALRHGLSESACRQAISRGNSPAADRVISKFLRVPLHELWPDRYDREGFPLCHVRDQISGEQNDRHRQIGTAA